MTNFTLFGGFLNTFYIRGGARMPGEMSVTGGGGGAKISNNYEFSKKKSDIHLHPPPWLLKQGSKKFAQPSKCILNFVYITSGWGGGRGAHLQLSIDKFLGVGGQKYQIITGFICFGLQLPHTPTPPPY